MAKLKIKNWKKIILATLAVIIGLIVIAITGIFLWMQTWKTHKFPDSPISIKYPANSFLVSGIANNIQEDLSLAGGNKNIFISLNVFDMSLPKNKNEDVEEIANGFQTKFCIVYASDHCKTILTRFRKENTMFYLLKTEGDSYEDVFYLFTSYKGTIYMLKFYIRIKNNNKLNIYLFRLITNRIIQSITLN